MKHAKHKQHQNNCDNYYDNINNNYNNNQIKNNTNNNNCTNIYNNNADNKEKNILLIQQMSIPADQKIKLMQQLLNEKP